MVRATISTKRDRGGVNSQYKSHFGALGVYSLVKPEIGAGIIIPSLSMMPVNHENTEFNQLNSNVSFSDHFNKTVFSIRIIENVYEFDNTETVESDKLIDIIKMFNPFTYMDMSPYGNGNAKVYALTKFTYQLENPIYSNGTYKITGNASYTMEADNIFKFEHQLYFEDSDSGSLATQQHCKLTLY